MHDGWSEHWCHHARVMTRSHTASSSSTAYPVARALVLPLLEHARHLAAACMSMATPACRSAVLMRGWQAAVHINLGYVYAEGGGQGLYPGAMPKAAGMRVSLYVFVCGRGDSEGAEEVAEAGERGGEGERTTERGRERERARESERETRHVQDVYIPFAEST